MHLKEEGTVSRRMRRHQQVPGEYIEGGAHGGGPAIEISSICLAQTAASCRPLTENGSLVACLSPRHFTFHVGCAKRCGRSARTTTPAPFVVACLQEKEKVLSVSGDT